MSDHHERPSSPFEPVPRVEQDSAESQEPLTEAPTQPSSAPWWLERPTLPTASPDQEPAELSDSQEADVPEHEAGEHEIQHPLDRVTRRLPRSIRVAVDWIVTIVGAIAIVLLIKAYVVNPYRIPSSSMEPTLHCARGPGAPGCEARFSDRVLANRFIYHFRSPKRGEIVVFKTPPEAKAKCGSGGTFVKRIVGLPRETVQNRLINGADYVYIDGRRLDEPYVQQDRRSADPTKTYKVPPSSYFMMGDNRKDSCDSRVWGSVPRKDLIGPVFMTYWPPNRISFR